jgi:hypothetical protein
VDRPGKGTFSVGREIARNEDLLDVHTVSLESVF